MRPPADSHHAVIQAALADWWMTTDPASPPDFTAAAEQTEMYLLSSGYTITPDTQESHTMDYPDALRAAVHDGQRIARTDWTTCGRCPQYVFLTTPHPTDPGANTPYLVQQFPTGVRQPYQPSQRDMLATNWHTVPATDTPAPADQHEQYAAAIEYAFLPTVANRELRRHMAEEAARAVSYLRDRELEQLCAAVAELAQAIRLTREYVGEELLPAVSGWAWYDALSRHAPHELGAHDQAAEPEPESEAEKTAAVFAALHHSAETTVTRVINLYETWVKAGPPPPGTSISRWWDTRLTELHTAIATTKD